MAKINNTFDMAHIGSFGLDNVYVVDEGGLPGELSGEGETKIIVYSANELEEALNDQHYRAVRDPNEYLMVNEETIQVIYAEVANGYRGNVCYWAIAKINDKWWELDIIGEGAAYEIEGATDESVTKAFAEHEIPE